jgi:hypothetical protein
MQMRCTRGAHSEDPQQAVTTVRVCLVVIGNRSELSTE